MLVGKEGNEKRKERKLRGVIYLASSPWSLTSGGPGRVQTGLSGARELECVPTTSCPQLAGLLPSTSPVLQE